MNKAVFLDKDGTLIIDVPYNANPDLIQLCRGCLTGLKQLQEQGYLLILVTNQAGIAHGYFNEDELSLVEDRIRQLLKQRGITLTAFYYCPHHPQGRVSSFARDCNCRKPKPGMLIQASAEHNIDLKASWMIGDILHDTEAGNGAGCRSILVDNGNETEWKLTPKRQPFAKLKTINEAAEFIISSNIDG